MQYLRRNEIAEGFQTIKRHQAAGHQEKESASAADDFVVARADSLVECKADDVGVVVRTADFLL